MAVRTLMGGAQQDTFLTDPQRPGQTAQTKVYTDATFTTQITDLMTVNSAGAPAAAASTVIADGLYYFRFFSPPGWGTEPMWAPKAYLSPGVPDPSAGALRIDPAPQVYGVANARHLSSMGVKLDGTPQDAAINNAFATAVANRHGIILPTSDPLLINTNINIPLTVPTFADGWGKNTAQQKAVWQVVDNPAAGVTYGDPTGTSSVQGGFLGGFTVDGNNVATNPLTIGFCSQLEGKSTLVVNAAAGGRAVQFLFAQNWRWPMLVIENCLGDGLVLDRGCGGGQFGQVELGDISGWLFRSTQTGTGRPYIRPSNVIIESGIWEHSHGTDSTRGIAWVEAGLDITFGTGVIMAAPNDAPYESVLKVTADILNPADSSVYLSSRVRFQGKITGRIDKSTGIEIGDRAVVVSEGGRVQSVKNAFRLAANATLEGDVFASSYRNPLHPSSAGTLDKVNVKTVRAAIETRKHTSSGVVETSFVTDEAMVATLSTTAGVTTWTYVSGTKPDVTANPGGKFQAWLSADTSGTTDGDEPDTSQVANTTFATVLAGGGTPTGTLTAPSTADGTVLVLYNEAGARYQRLANGSDLVGSGADFLYGVGRRDNLGRNAWPAYAVGAGGKPNYGGVTGAITFGAASGTPATPVDDGTTGRERGHLWYDGTENQLKAMDTAGRTHRVTAPRVVNPQSGGLYARARHITTTAAGSPPSGTMSCVPFDIGGAGLTIADLEVIQTTQGVNAGGSTMTATLAIYRASTDGTTPDWTSTPLLTGTFDASSATGTRTVTPGSSLTVPAGSYWLVWFYLVTGTPTTAAAFTCITGAQTAYGLNLSDQTTVARSLIKASLSALPTTATTLTVAANGTSPVVIVKTT